MGKHVEGLDAVATADIFRAMRDAGIGIHVNLICGFPGETVGEAEATVSFVIAALRDHPGATYLLNPFTVFPSTPIADNPAAFGIVELCAGGDMPAAYAFALDKATTAQTLPVARQRRALDQRLHEGLDWTQMRTTAGGRAAHYLYSSSGHSLVFKAAQLNAFDAARRPAPASARLVPRASAGGRVFVTGASGNAGRAVTTELIARGYEVTALMREGAPLDLRCNVLRGDLHDLADLSRGLRGVDAIIHCASPRSLDREVVLRTEVEGAARLLDAWSSGTFVGMSSQTVYGVPSGILRESAPLAPESWYDIGKAINERQLQLAAGSGERGPAVSLRIPLLFGSGPRRRNGQYLCGIFDALRAGKAFVFGCEQAMERCGSVYIGEEDLGRAVVDSIAVTQEGAFNVASGFVAWRELIDALGELVDVRPRYRIRGESPLGADEVRLPQSRSEYDCTRFATATGFVPRQTLDEILRAFVDAERVALTV
jgi:nucleoside-diphosphate-sugar epimerase